MKLKPILFSLSVLILSFAFGYFIFAWQEPTSPPPEGNVPTPINVGAEPQAKVGRISATEFGDSNNPSYFLNPEGNSLFGGITETNTLRLTPRAQPTTPQEGQFYWDSELHTFCYYSGSEWICLAEPEAPPGLCADWPTQTDDPDCGVIDCSGWYVQTGDEGSAQTEYCYNKQDITTDRCEGVDDCKDENSPDCDAQSNDALQYSCETCCYISSASCAGTTKGSCSYYSSGTQGPTSDYYWSSGNTCYYRDYHCTGDSCGETYTDTLQYSCGTCQYISGCSGGDRGSCVSKTTSWGGGSSYGCSGTDKRCYNGVCRDCSNNGGWFYNGYCWYAGSWGQSCTTVCSGRGGNPGSCSEPNDCTLVNHFVSKDCRWGGWAGFPGWCGWTVVDELPGQPICSSARCYYRTGSGSCSASHSQVARICACNY